MIIIVIAPITLPPTSIAASWMSTLFVIPEEKWTVIHAGGARPASIGTHSKFPAKIGLSLCKRALWSLRFGSSLFKGHKKSWECHIAIYWSWNVWTIPKKFPQNRDFLPRFETTPTDFASFCWTVCFVWTKWRQICKFGSISTHNYPPKWKNSPKDAP